MPKPAGPTASDSRKAATAAARQRAQQLRRRRRPAGSRRRVIGRRASMRGARRGQPLDRIDDMRRAAQPMRQGSSSEAPRRRRHADDGMAQVVGERGAILVGAARQHEQVGRLGDQQPRAAPGRRASGDRRPPCCGSRRRPAPHRRGCPGPTPRRRPGRSTAVGGAAGAARAQPRQAPVEVGDHRLALGLPRRRRRPPRARTRARRRGPAASGTTTTLRPSRRSRSTVADTPNGPASTRSGSWRSTSSAAAARDRRCRAPSRGSPTRTDRRPDASRRRCARAPPARPAAGRCTGRARRCGCGGARRLRRSVAPEHQRHATERARRRQATAASAMRRRSRLPATLRTRAVRLLLPTLPPMPSGPPKVSLSPHRPRSAPTRSRTPLGSADRAGSPPAPNTSTPGCSL